MQRCRRTCRADSTRRGSACCPSHCSPRRRGPGRLHPSGIDDAAAGEAAAVFCLHRERAAGLTAEPDGGHAGAELEAGAVCDGILGHGERELPGVDDGRGRGVEGCRRLRGDAGLERPQLLLSDDAEIRNAVPAPALEQQLEMGAVRLVKAQHQRPVFETRDIEIGADFAVELHAAHVHLSHQRAWFRVEARMQNRRIRL